MDDFVSGFKWTIGFLFFVAGMLVALSTLAAIIMIIAILLGLG